MVRDRARGGGGPTAPAAADDDDDEPPGMLGLSELAADIETRRRGYVEFDPGIF